MGKPFLRWAGSKRQLVSSLVNYWTNEHARYVEPFVGSAQLFFKLEPEFAVLGDINEDLILMYETIRNKPTEVHSVFSQWANNEDQYYRIRAIEANGLGEIHRAARFIYLNRFCFNGLYRTNRHGQFNVPYGGHKCGLLPTVDDLTAASRLLKRASLICGDFEATLNDVKNKDFVYLDPPFVTTNKRVFGDYGPKLFQSEDVGRLGEALDRLDKVGATFVLSYADCREGRTLAETFVKRRVRTRRNIAGFANRRKVTNELLITNATN